MSSAIVRSVLTVSRSAFDFGTHKITYHDAIQIVRLKAVMTYCYEGAQLLLVYAACY